MAATTVADAAADESIELLVVLCTVAVRLAAACCCGIATGGGEVDRMKFDDSPDGVPHTLVMVTRFSNPPSAATTATPMSVTSLPSTPARTLAML